MLTRKLVLYTEQRNVRTSKVQIELPSNQQFTMTCQLNQNPEQQKATLSTTE